MSALPTAITVSSGHKALPMFSRDRVLACGPSAVWQSLSTGPSLTQRLPTAPSRITSFVEPG